MKPRISFSLSLLGFLSFSAKGSSALTLLKTKEMEEKTTTSNSDTEPSATAEFLSVLELGLEILTEKVQDSRKNIGECERLQREMDTAMNSYKAHHNKEDAVKVLTLMESIVGMDACSFLSNSSLDDNAVFIARDQVGLLPIPDDKEPARPDHDAKSYLLGRKTGHLLARWVASQHPDIQNIFL